MNCILEYYLIIKHLFRYFLSSFRTFCLTESQKREFLKLKKKFLDCNLSFFSVQMTIFLIYFKALLASLCFRPIKIFSLSFMINSSKTLIISMLCIDDRNKLKSFFSITGKMVGFSATSLHFIEDRVLGRFFIEEITARIKICSTKY